MDLCETIAGRGYQTSAFTDTGHSEAPTRHHLHVRFRLRSGSSLLSIKPDLNGGNLVLDDSSRV
jgi:hypothetical protein